MPKRKWTTEEKFNVVLAGLKDSANIAEIARSQGISCSLFYKWKDKFLQGAKEGLERINKKDREEKDQQKEVDQLHRKIGELAVSVDLLKKTQNL